MDEYRIPRLANKQPASDLGGPGTQSNGPRQSQAIEEEVMIEGWSTESSDRIKNIHRAEQGRA